MLPAQEPVEGVVVRARVPGADERPGEVRPAPDAVADVRADRVEIQRKPVLDQARGHPLAPRAPLLLPPLELGVELRVLLVHEEGQDVDVVLPSPLRGDLGARQEAHAPAPGLLARLGQALQRVVVGQRKGVEPGLGHAADERRGIVEAVRAGGVAVEIDLHAINSPSPPAGGEGRGEGGANGLTAHAL